MRRLTILLVAAGLLAACGGEPPTSPAPQGVRTNRVPANADTTGFPRWLARLPANLALSAAQEQTIQGYVAAFRAATQSDRQSLRGVFQQMRQARRGGATRDQLQPLFQQSAPARERIRTAAAQLHQQIDGALTADQKAWLAANTCDPATAPRLSDAQRAQLESLLTSFRQANQSDLATLRQAFQQARQARQNGATADHLRAIVAAVQPARDRLAAAHQQLASQIQALLTPEQKASACFARGISGRAPGGFGPGFRRVGPGGSGPGFGPGFRRGTGSHSS